MIRLNPDSRHLALAVGVIVAAAFYRPIAFWAINAWDLSSPLKLLLIGLGVAVVGIAVLALMIRLGAMPLVAGLAIGGILWLFSNWQQLVGSTGPLFVGLIVIVAWLAQRRFPSALLFWLAVWFFVALGLIPVVQLVVTHVQDSAPYPLLDLPSPKPATASGHIEDVVLVIVDAYPNLRIGESWFDHDSDLLVDSFESQGFTVAPNAWSRHTFTSLSVSGILELSSVIEAGPTGEWGNRSSLWHIIRGDSLVSQTLKFAGFTYTHIESGWEGTTCGRMVDRCVDSPWIDEQVWRLLDDTIALPLIIDRYYSFTGTINTADALRLELTTLLDNGSHDYVFAHLLLPHEPALVNPTCQLRDEAPADLPSRRAAISEQMSCVDLLLTSVVDTVDEDTAALFTGDHGSGTGGQVGRDPDEWSDADVAERFSVFMAYKLPPECGSPALPDPMVVMNTVLSCAVTGEFLTPLPQYLIGDQDPAAVEPERMEQIQAKVNVGSLVPETYEVTDPGND